MLRFVAGLLLVLCLGSAPALAQTDEDVNGAIEMNLGDHTAYREAFDAIQQAVADDDAAAFAAWVSYPINVVAEGEKLEVTDEAQFEEHYDAVVTDEIKDAISSQKWQDLFVNYQGVMFGNGQVWLNGICKNDSCSEFDVKIITIQSTAS
jgi:hypothetical protein